MTCLTQTQHARDPTGDRKGGGESSEGRLNAYVRILLLWLGTATSRIHREMGEGTKESGKWQKRRPVRDKRNIQGQINRPCGFDCFHSSSAVVKVASRRVMIARQSQSSICHRCSCYRTCP